MKTRTAFVPLLAAAFTIGAIPAAKPPAGLVLSVRELPSPARPGSLGPDLTNGSGKVWMSWIQSGTSGDTLRISRLDGDRWSEPRTVVTDPVSIGNAADRPRLLSMSPGILIASWSHKLEQGGEASEIRVAHSSDDGAHWSAPLVPHHDATMTEHGFVALAPFDRGAAVVWLDGRDYARNGEHGQSSMRMAAFDNAWHLSEERVLDDRVCDCCPVSVTVPPGGGDALVAYRNRSNEEVRDISLVRVSSTRPPESRPLSAEGWKINGCPVNGPAIDASGREVVAAWYTGVGGSPRVRAAFSADTGRTFGTPLEVARSSPLGQVSVTHLQDGRALVLWLEPSPGHTLLRAREIARDGTMRAAWTVATLGIARADWPRIVRSSDGLVMAWTDRSGTPRVHTAVLTLPKH